MPDSIIGYIANLDQAWQAEVCQSLHQMVHHAIPEVTDLPKFCSRFRLTLAGLGRETARETRWPMSSVVEMAAQGGLSLAARDQAAGIAIEQATQTEVEYSISGVDYLHFRPGKNGPRMLGAGRLTLTPDLARK